MALISTNGMGVFRKGAPARFLNVKASTLGMGVFVKGQGLRFLAASISVPAVSGTGSVMTLDAFTVSGSGVVTATPSAVFGETVFGLRGFDLAWPRS